VSAPSENPYQAPAVEVEPDDEAFPAAAVKQVQNVIREARLAVLAGLLIPLVFLLPLVRWHSLRTRYPQLAGGDAGEHAELARKFRSARPKLWFGVLWWPAMVSVLAIYSHETSMIVTMLVLWAIVGLSIACAASLRFRHWFRLIVGLTVGIGLVLFAPLGVYVLVRNYSQGKPFSIQLALMTAAGLWMAFALLRSLPAIVRARRLTASANPANPKNER
jgi:hypothetical protein